MDEGSALGVTATGSSTVFGASAGAYFFNIGTPVTRTCQAGTALSFYPVITHHVPVGKQFNITSWTTADATPYTIRATSGVLSSSTGSIY